jgi:hypothetical protein
VKVKKLSVMERREGRKQTESTEDIYNNGAGRACFDGMSMNHSSYHCYCPWQPAATGK